MSGMVCVTVRGVAWHGFHRQKSDGEAMFVKVKELDPAEQYRLAQARELLREAGFVEAPDGTWHPADEDAPSDQFRSQASETEHTPDA
jgi:hypothetical protein